MHRSIVFSFTLILKFVGVGLTDETCLSGWHIVGEQKKCVPCPNGCQECNESECLKFYDEKNSITKWPVRTNIRLLAGCDAQCSNCSGSSCTQCIDGFAFIGGSGNCGACHSTCLTCSDSNNDGTCLTCVSTRFLNGSNYCRLCTDYWSYCIRCNSARCLDCGTNYYLNPSGTGCLSCSSISYCVSCTSSGCLACQPFYQVLNNTCIDICGDFHIITLPCDNAKGIPYDGCDDSCSVMFDFSCVVNGSSNVCSFTGQLQITQVTISKLQFENKLELVVNLFPPLDAFSNTALNQIFFVNDTDLTIDRLLYQNGQLKIQLSFTTSVVDRPFQLLFEPSLSTDPRFSQSISQVFTTVVKTTNPAYFYSQTNFQLSKILNYFAYILIGLAWLIFFIGIFSRKLAGLQIMFVLQYAWVALLWLPDSFPLAYSMTMPLKYSSGYGLPLTQLSHSTQLPFQSDEFKIDSKYFSNNFNLTLIFYIVPILGALICKILTLTEKYKQSAIQKWQFFMELSMYGVMVNIIGLTSFSFIFFSSTEMTNVPSLVIFSFSALVTFAIFIKFYFDPDPFQRFRYSFNIEILAFHHYFLHLINLISIVLLIGLLPSVYWACIIPLGLLALETLVYRPYRQLSENLRSFFYLILMVLTAVLRMIFSLNNNQWRMSDISTILLFGLVCGLYLLAVVWAYVEVFRDIVCTKKIQNPQKKQLEYTLFEDLKFMKQIGNPQKIMELTGLNPIKSFNIGLKTAKNSECFSMSDQENSSPKNFNKENLQNNRGVKLQNSQSHKQNQHQIRVKCPQPIKEKDLGSEGNDNKDEDYSFNEEIQKNLLRKDIIGTPIHQAKTSFKIAPEKPLFQQIFSYLGEEKKMSFLNFEPATQHLEPIPEANKNTDDLDESQKTIMRKVIKKEINFVKIKNAEELSKPKDQKLLSEYLAI